MGISICSSPSSILVPEIHSSTVHTLHAKWFLSSTHFTHFTHARVVVSWGGGGNSMGPRTPTPPPPQGAFVSLFWTKNQNTVSQIN